MDMTFPQLKIHLVHYLENIFPWVQPNLYTPFWRYYWNPVPGGVLDCGAERMGLTPEAVAQKEALIKENAKVYVIDDAELKRVYDSYPVIWKNKEATPKLCFMGCPLMSLRQLMDWTDRVEEGLRSAGNTRVVIPTVFTAAPGVLREFEKTPYAARLRATGVITSAICPLMYMNNPLSTKMPVITSSNKLRTYTSARYYTDDEILEQITKGGIKA